MPLTADQLAQLKRLNEAQRQLIEAFEAQLRAEETTAASGLYPDPRTLTRKP